MRKIITLLVCINVFIIAGKAQYVYYPDGYFKSFLMQRYPTCFDADGNLDTTCTLITQEDTLIFHNMDWVPTIQYFKSLRYLDCSGNGPLWNNSAVGLIEIP